MGKFTIVNDDVEIGPKRSKLQWCVFFVVGQCCLVVFDGIGLFSYFSPFMFLLFLSTQDLSLKNEIQSLIDKYGVRSLLDVRASDGKGALHWAYEYCNVVLEKWLIQNKFNVNVQDIYLKKPIEYNYKSFAAPGMSRDVLQTIVNNVKKQEILLAAEGYVQGKTGWYVNRQGNLLWYDVVDGEWVRIHERMVNGMWSRDKKDHYLYGNEDKKKKRRKKKKKRKRKRL